MKKMILLIALLAGITFARTGMMTPAGESGMGVWLNYEVATLGDDDGWKSTYTVSFDYMTTMGIEVGFSMGNGLLGMDDADWKGIDLGYHHKMEKWNMNVSWNRRMYDDYGDIELDLDQLWVLGYCDTGLYGGLGGYNMDSNWAGLDSDGWEFELLKIGYHHSLDMGMTVGVEYYADKDDIADGTVSFLAGYNF